jgi:hypothetical protein
MENSGDSIAVNYLWRRYGPGRKEAIGFVVLALSGFIAWLAQSGYVISTLLDIEPLWGYVDTGLFPLVFLVCGVLAFLGGVLLPKGFYLWGVAVYLHAPFAEVMVVEAMEREGIGLTGGDTGIASYAIMTAMLIFSAMILFTGMSALGMGARTLTSHARRSG